MPTYAYSTLNELVAYLQAQIGPNGNQDITGQKHQDVVVTIALSLVNIVSSIPPTTVNQFPAYDAEQVYTGGVEVIVRHANKLWLFVNASDQVGVTPGTNGLVWQEISAAQLAHFRNHDAMLDEGGANQVTAAELRALLDAPAPAFETTWYQPFDELDVTPPGSPDPDLVYLIDVGGTGAWSGHDLSLAQYVGGSWTFTQLEDGAVVRWRAGGFIVFVTSGALVLYDLDSFGTPVPANLSEVLTVGANSGSNRPVLQLGYHMPGTTINHVSAGAQLLDPTATAVWNIAMQADLVLNVNATAIASLYMVSIHRAPIGGTNTFGLGSNWVVPDDIIIPSTLGNNEILTILCTGENFGYSGIPPNRMLVLSITKRTL